MGDVRLLKVARRLGPTFHTDRAIFGVLVDYMRDDDCLAWPSVATIAAEIGVTDRGVRKRLRRLETDGWITAVRRGGGRSVTTLYRVNLERLENPEQTRNKPGTENPEQTRNGTTVNPERNDRKPGTAFRGPLIERLERSAAASSASKTRNSSEPVQSALLLPIDGGREPDPVLAVLTELVSGHARRWAKLRADTAAALDNGWTVESLTRHVRRRLDAGPRTNPDGFVWEVMRGLGTPEDEMPAPPQPVDKPRCVHGKEHGDMLFPDGVSVGGCVECERTAAAAAGSEDEKPRHRVDPRVVARVAKSVS